MSNIPFPSYSDMPYLQLQMQAMNMRQEGRQSLMKAGRTAVGLGAKALDNSIRYHQAKETRQALVDTLNALKERDPKNFYATGLRDPNTDIPPVPKGSEIPQYLDKLNTAISAIADAALKQGLLQPGELYSLLKVAPDSEEVRRNLAPRVKDVETQQRRDIIERMAEEEIQSRGGASPVAQMEIEGPLRPGESRMAQQPQDVTAQREYQPISRSQLMASPKFSKSLVGGPVQPQEIRDTRRYQALVEEQIEQRQAANQALRERDMARKEANIVQQALDKKADRELRRAYFTARLRESGIKESEKKFAELNTALRAAVDDAYRADVELDKRIKEQSLDLDPYDMEKLAGQIERARQRSVSANTIAENLGRIANWIASNPTISPQLTSAEMSALIARAYSMGNRGEVINPETDAISAGYIRSGQSVQAGGGSMAPAPGNRTSKKIVGGRFELVESE